MIVDSKQVTNDLIQRLKGIDENDDQAKQLDEDLRTIRKLNESTKHWANHSTDKGPIDMQLPAKVLNRLDEYVPVQMHRVELAKQICDWVNLMYLSENSALRQSTKQEFAHKLEDRLVKFVDTLDALITPTSDKIFKIIKAEYPEIIITPKIQNLINAEMELITARSMEQKRIACTSE